VSLVDFHSRESKTTNEKTPLSVVLMDSSWLRSLLVAAIDFLYNWYGYHGANKQDNTGPGESTLLIIKPDGFKLGIRDVLYDRMENELGLT